MKNNKHRYMVLALAAVMAISSLAGCSDGKKDNSSSSTETTTIDPSILRQPLEFVFPTDELEEGATQNPLDAQDPTGAPSGDDDNSSNPGYETSQPATEYIPVTDANGQPETEYVPVTDANNQPVTDAEGQPETEVIEVTTAVTVEDNSGNAGGSTEAYTPYNESAYAFWIDISERRDFNFDDEFIKVTFRVKDTAPDGAYDIVISNPDFSLYGGISLDPDTIVNGKVFVNTDAEAQREITDADGFTVYCDNQSAKQGEEVTVTFSMKNNPGMCAMMFWFDYDRNAMDIVSCEAVGEFADVAQATLNGLQ